jgi:hypothetical protein
VVPSPYCGNNRWLSRVHRELIFSSRGRRHAAQQVFGKAADHASALSPKFNFNSPCSSCSRPRWRRGRDTQPHRRLAREETRVESCKRAPPRRGRLERNSPFFFFHHYPDLPPLVGLALAGRNPASRRLISSLRELIAFSPERTSGRHSPKCQRLFQWRTASFRGGDGNDAEQVGRSDGARKKAGHTAVVSFPCYGNNDQLPRAPTTTTARSRSAAVMVRGRRRATRPWCPLPATATTTSSRQRRQR